VVLSAELTSPYKYLNIQQSLKPFIRIKHVYVLPMCCPSCVRGNGRLFIHIPWELWDAIESSWLLIFPEYSELDDDKLNCKLMSVNIELLSVTKFNNFARLIN